MGLENGGLKPEWSYCQVVLKLVLL